MEKKRRNSVDEHGKTKRREETDQGEVMLDDTEELQPGEFEDPYEDEIEDEEIVEDPDELELLENMGELELEEFSKKQKEKLEKALEEEEAEENVATSVWRPGKDKLEEDEILDYDPSAYVMFHKMTTEWPCLSFDILPDKLGSQRARFPHTVYLVTGTQTANEEQNKLNVWKVSELTKTQHDDDSENDDDEADDDPILEERCVYHPGAVNRVKVMPQAPHYVASCSEDRSVYVWDLSDQISALDKPPFGRLNTSPVAKLSEHLAEGFALGWSSLKPGRLLSGDMNNQIFLTELQSNSEFKQHALPYNGHLGSVEDVQWSPTETEVFASCSTDKTIKLWDTRVKKTPAISFIAADCDVNVISWSKRVTYLLASGADDGSFSIWDLRALKANNKCELVAHFKWHQDQITSIEWDPSDESVLSVSGADGQVTVWDLSVEKDSEVSDAEVSDIPDQLLFSHQGQIDTKEAHWHPQIPGLILSTAENGFDFFKPAIDARAE